MGAAAAAGLVGVAIVVGFFPQGGRSANSGQAGLHVEARQPAPPVQSPKPYYRKWTFELGPPPDGVPLSGTMRWLPAQRSRPAMLCSPADGSAQFSLPFSLPPGPFVVKIKERAAVQRNGKIDLSAELGFIPAPLTKGLRQAPVWVPFNGKAQLLAVWFFNRCLVTTVNNEIYAITEIAWQDLPKRLKISPAGGAIEEIEVREVVDESEIPFAVRFAATYATP